ncbi:hypothetical protein RIF29_13622 [Crotalaria pallida]|uniref:Uncharacterized protein n=1 Tax=Crotalaria pallida TaxID=3830 RepID=A0AAN9IPP5_CROPI
MPADHRLTVLILGDSALNKVPSSVLHLQNLETFFFPICESLKDLPENFANRQIVLSDSKTLGGDALITLRTVLPCPVFRNVRCLSIRSSKLSELPDNIWLLSSLETLKISGCNFISLPESIKYLPRLVLIDVSQNQMLRSVPALPQSIESFYGCDCVSLKTLLGSKTEPSKKTSCIFLLHNCINLDQDAYDAILKDAITRIEYGANSMSAVTLENEDDVEEEIVISSNICYFLPARRGKVGECFHYSATQASITIELNPIFKSLGFVLYFVLSQVHSCYINVHVSLGCECYLEKSSGEMVIVTSFWVDKYFSQSILHSYKLISDHVLLWYDAQCCEGITEAIKEIKAINDGNTTDNLTFKFFTCNDVNEVLVIKECGVRWIYPSDQIVEEGRGCKCKRGRDIYESHNGTIVRNGATKCESDEPDEMVPPSKKLKQCVFGTPSNLDRKEVEDLRLLLELHLHIGEDLKFWFDVTVKPNACFACSN